MKKISIYNQLTNEKKQTVIDGIRLKVLKLEPIDTAAYINFPDRIHVVVIDEIKSIKQFDACIFNLAETSLYTLEIIFFCNVKKLREKIGNQQSILRRIELKEV